MGLLKRLEPESKSRKSPDENLIFLGYGANDLAIIDKEQVVRPEIFRENLQLAVTKAKETTDHIFLISILPVSSRIDGITVSSGKMRTNENIVVYNELINEIALRNNTLYIDLLNFTSNKSLSYGLEKI